MPRLAVVDVVFCVLLAFAAPAYSATEEPPVLSYTYDQQIESSIPVAPAFVTPQVEIRL